jgi:flagellar motor switch protein FliN/FliY
MPSNRSPGSDAVLAERLQVALSSAIAGTFGVEIENCAITAGPLSSLLAGLGDEIQVHVEVEAALGAAPAGMVLLVLPLEPGAKLLGVALAESPRLANPDAQLQTLADLSEGTEALARALSGALSTDEVFLALRVSGASLVEPGTDEPLPRDEDFSGFGATIDAAEAGSFSLVIALAASLADALVAGGIEAAPDTMTAERLNRIAAATGTRREMSTASPADSAPARPTARPYSLEQLEAPEGPGTPFRDLDPILSVSLRLSVELGAVEMTVEEVLELGPGSVVELDRLAGEPIDVVVNGRVLAHGEVVVVDESFGVRITEIIGGRRLSVA